jgi:type II secretory pathway pseudopilin PulG
MRRRGTRGAAVLLAAVASATVVAWPAHARADEAQPSAEHIKAAAEEFDRGRRAYLAKDYEQAAGHFENAFRDAPSKETLRLAIRARRDAKQPARAATLAAIAQSQYGSDAQTAHLAKETLAEATPALSEYVVECSTPCTIAADSRVVSQSDALKHRVYLDPGAHDLGVSFQQGGSVSKHVEGAKGSSTTLAFEPPPPPAPLVTAPAPPPDVTRSGPPPAHEKPLGPAVFFVAGGVTLAALAGTIASGIATQNDPGPDAVRRECAGKGESCALYQEGQDAETRTNILLGVTIGAAVVTGAIGLFFTQWSSSPAQTTGGRPKPTQSATALRFSPFGLSGSF